MNEIKVKWLFSQWTQISLMNFCTDRLNFSNNAIVKRVKGNYVEQVFHVNRGTSVF